MKILMVFATGAEADILRSISGEYPDKQELFYHGAEISVLITGVGGISTSWAMQKWIHSNPAPDLSINAGIAGSFNDKFVPGSVVMPVTDCFADLGVERENKYLTLSEAGIMDPCRHPFKGGLIHSDNKYVARVSSSVPSVKGVTVNTVSGTLLSIERLKKKFNPDIETMEGATFFYICARENIPFLALRAVSNMVGADRRTSWEIGPALDNLAGKMKEILNILE